MFFDPQCQPVSEPVTTNPAAQLLRKAAQVLRERGHAKGCWEDYRNGAVCLVGAIAYTALGDTDFTSGEDQFVDEVLCLLEPDAGGNTNDAVDLLTTWNDEEVVTSEVVTARLEYAAAKLEQGI